MYHFDFSMFFYSAAINLIVFASYFEDYMVKTFVLLMMLFRNPNDILGRNTGCYYPDQLQSY